MEMMYGLRAIQPSVVDRPGARELEWRGGEIEFRDVWFGFSPNQQLLKG